MREVLDDKVIKKVKELDGATLTRSPASTPTCSSAFGRSSSRPPRSCRPTSP
jgi:hypothetical protein